MSFSDASEIITQRSTDRVEWLKARRSGIGASEIPAVLGVSPYSSPLAVYAEKIDPDPPSEDDGNERLAWGRRLEPIILSRFGEVTGRVVEPDGRLRRSRRWPFLLATLDGEQYCPELSGDYATNWLPVEVKNTQDRAGWSDGVPRHVWVQVQAQLAVTNAPVGSVAVLICGCEFRRADIERDDGFIEILVAEAERFWERVEFCGPPPPVDGSEATREALKRLYPEDDGEAVALAGEFTDKAELRLELKREIKIREEILRATENEIRATIGGATYGALQNGGRFSLKTNKNGVRTLRYNAPTGEGAQ